MQMQHHQHYAFQDAILFRAMLVTLPQITDMTLIMKPILWHVSKYQNILQLISILIIFIIFTDFSSQTLRLSVYQTAFGETIPGIWLQKRKVEMKFKSLFSILVHLPEEQVNACNDLVGATCPVNAHQMLTHGGNIEGEGDLHGGIPVRMRIEIADDADHLCMCAVIDVIVH